MKRLLLMVTLTTVLATLMIGTAGYAKDIICQETDDCGTVVGSDKTPDDPGHDYIQGNDKANDIKGLGGNDVIDGKGGNDTIHGNGGGDTLYGREGDDRLIGGGGNDTLWGGPGNDTLLDEQGPLTGHDADTDYLYGGAGNDTLNAHDGDEKDWLYGGDGTDTCIAEVNDKYNGCETGEKWTLGPNSKDIGWTGNNN